MSGRKLTPWFNVLQQPPVNGGKWAMYDWRCPVVRVNGARKPRWALSEHYGLCPRCQWRGLASPPKDAP